MIEDAKVLDDGPAFEPTKRLRGLAAVGDVVDAFVEASAMSEHEEDVSGRGKLHVPVDRFRTGRSHTWERLQCRKIIGLFANTEDEKSGYVVVQTTPRGLHPLISHIYCNGVTLGGMKWWVA